MFWLSCLPASRSLKVTTHTITWKSSRSHSTSPAMNLTLLVSFPSGASKAVCTKPGRPLDSSWSAQTGHPCLPALQVTNLIQSDLCFSFQRRSKPWWPHRQRNNLHLSRCQNQICLRYFPTIPIWPRAVRLPRHEFLSNDCTRFAQRHTTSLDQLYIHVIFTGLE